MSASLLIFFLLLDHSEGFVSRKPVIMRTKSNKFMVVDELVRLSEGIISDSLTLGTIATAGDFVAQFYQRQPFENRISPDLLSNVHSMVSTFDIERSQRFAAFGLFDGVVTHSWYFSLNNVVHGTDVWAIGQKVMADALIYQPLWCAYFLFLMTYLEKKNVDGVVHTFKADWWELFANSSWFYVPLSCFVYGFIPTENWLITFSTASFVFTILLSLWKSSTTEAKTSPAN